MTDRHVDTETCCAAWSGSGGRLILEPMTKPPESQTDAQGSGSKKPPAPPVAVMDAGEPPRRRRFPAASMSSAVRTVAEAARAQRDGGRYVRRPGN
jgi:hypothetical protein